MKIWEERKQISMILLLVFGTRIPVGSSMSLGAARCRALRGWRPGRLAMSSSTECFDSEEVEAVSTRYTIDTPPIDPKLLRATVHKNMANFDRYLASRPIARHTADAFAQFQAALQTESDVSTTGYILDSGCGTGRSSLVLGQMYPDKMIVGVDRSIDRLGRTASNLSSLADEDVDGGNDDGDGDDHIEFRNEDKGGTHVQRVRDNVILVRAELIHFYRLWMQHHMVADAHYMLYPNPYPKKSRLKQRWYAHPSFPLLLLVSAGNPLVLRSNWEQYLHEFADAVEYASVFEASGTHDASDAVKRASELAGQYLESALKGPQLRSPGNAWTNFEAKYDNVGEATFELSLCSSSSGPSSG